MTWKVHLGAVPDVLREIPGGSVQCVVTSPPYWGLRAYTGEPGMIGLEPTLDEHLANLVAVFAEVRRVLRDDGVCWINYGDAYSNARLAAGGSHGGWNGSSDAPQRVASGSNASLSIPLAPKQRLLLPARVALALQDDGWWIRSEIIWAKGVSFCPTYSGSCMPSSVKDRPTDSHEMVYLLSKRPRYFYDADAVRETAVMRPQRRAPRPGRPAHGRPPGHPPDAGLESLCRDEPGVDANPAGRNLRTVWTINPQAFADAHFATFPESLVRPCILAGTSERGACSECGAPWRRVVEAKGGVIGQSWHSHDDDMGRGNCKGGTGDPMAKARGAMAEGYSRTTTGWEPTCEHADAPIVPQVVLDPFSGSSTTGVVALRLGRDYVGCEISPEYLAMSEKRLANALNPEARPLKVAEGQFDLFGGMN